jgi:prepilin-type N-terminal cleavage/methylation domain-containing protein
MQWRVSLRFDAPPTAAQPRTGMTLIELLLAIAIAGLIVTIAFSTYHAVDRTRRAQAERLDRGGLAAAALRALSHDLACAFSGADPLATRFTLTPPDPTPADFALSFCCAYLPDGETDLAWHGLERVSYRLADHFSDGMELRRESRELSGPGALITITNRLADGITLLQIALFDGAAWTNGWAGGGATPLPRAARIKLAWREQTGARSLDTEVFIPAGNSVATRIERPGLAATNAPPAD